MTTKAYPRSTITLTNLGIGGENSTEGVNRLPSQRRGACGLGGRSDEGVSQGRCRRDSPTMNNTMLAVGCVRACCEINFGTVPPGGTSRDGGIVAVALRQTDATERVPPILKHPLSRCKFPAMFPKGDRDVSEIQGSIIAGREDPPRN